MHLADSLYNYAVDENQKAKALMLSADIMDKQEKRKEGIDYAQKALEVVQKSNDFSFEARIYGYMSTQYRRLGFSDKGKEYMLKGLDVSSKIKNKHLLTKYQAMANHELADYAMDEGDYIKAIDYLNLALMGYKKEENPVLKDFIVGNAEELLGRCYMALGNFDQALVHFSEANNLIKHSEANNTIWASMIYQGLGATYLKKKELDSAEIFLKKSLQIAKEASHGSLKELIYETMAEYYSQRHQLDSFAIFTSKYIDISKSNRSKKNRMINNEFNRVFSSSQEKANNTPIYVIASIILTIGIILLFYYFRRKKGTKIIDDGPEIYVDDKSSPVSMATSTHEKLLKKLEEFESSELFLDKNMSLSVLVGFLNTNAKYLNHILKNFKKTDFNTYINDLRIGYIISKLESDPDFLKYKISYLASLAGFSSHSNFSANFKRVTEFSPSEYIESLSYSA